MVKELFTNNADLRDELETNVRNLYDINPSKTKTTQESE